MRLIACSIHGNQAYYPGSGGGIEARTGANVYLEACSIYNNHASNSVQTCYDGSCSNGIGGGVRNSGGTITMANCVVHSNTATRDRRGPGQEARR